MEQKTIPFNKGIVRNTSLATDGELTDCVNLMPKDGQMMNAPQPKKTKEIPEGLTLLHIHSMSAKDVEIYKYTDNEGEYIVYPSEGSTDIVNMPGYKIAYTLEEDEILYEVKHIGNTLVVLTSALTSYYLHTNGEYNEQIFDFSGLELQFALDGEFTFSNYEGHVEMVKGEDSTFAGKEVKMQYFYNVRNLTINYNFKAGYTYRYYWYKDQSAPNNNKYIRFFVILHYEDGSTKVLNGDAKNPNKYYFTCDKNANKLELAELNVGRGAKSGTFYLGERYSGDLIHITRAGADAVLGLVNKVMNEYGNQKNKFVFPFFVRYAVELYDGSFVYPSAPCLMVPCDSCTPYVFSLEEPSVSKEKEISAGALLCSLLYKVVGGVTPLKLQRDTIKGIAIAVSAPIYMYDQSKNSDDDLATAFAYASDNPAINDKVCSLKMEDKYIERTMGDIWKSNDTFTGQTPHTFSLPQYDNLQEQVEKASTFYIVKRITLDELTEMDDFQEIEMDDGTLGDALYGRETLPDSTETMTKYSAKTAFAFNSRLSLANVTEIHPKGYFPSLMQGYMNYESADSTEENKYKFATETAVALNDVTQNAILIEERSPAYIPIRWLFFPNSSARAITVVRQIDDRTVLSAEMELKKHPYLNGAYWFDGFRPLEFATTRAPGLPWAEMPTEERYLMITSPQKIKTSQVNNPFVMEQTSSLNVNILALATATKAVSQGQFGQFPLYAFCDDGVWALEPSADGAWSSKQPISRDVCSNPKAIVQTDGAVVFPTKQGLKMLQGSETINISTQMDGKLEDSSSFCKNLAGEEYDNLVMSNTRSFNDLLQAAQIVYDYTNNLLHIYTDEGTFVYNLETGDYTRSDAQMPDSIVPGYPDTTIQVGKNLYIYDKPSQDGTRRGILLTRETSFDDPTALKVIADLKLLRRHGDAKVAVWASNDRQNWVRMRSLRMHSYKWFRFAIFTHLDNTDALEGIAARVETRRSNKMR